MTRALATIRRISDIRPIEGADKISVATVDGWKVVIANDVGHRIGDLVVYFEIDSLLPERPEFEFLRKSCYVKNSANGAGFRLKTIKLRGQISQGLVMPVDEQGEKEATVFGELEGAYRPFLVVLEGDDVTEFLGVKKYEKPIPVEMAGKMKGNFPSFIPKTDAERIQNCYDDFDKKWRGHCFEVTIKLDGTSATYYIKDGVFGVCSRNIDLLETDDNLYWQIARSYDIENKLKAVGYDVAIQGEIMGPGVQGNKEGFDEHRFFVFNVWDIKKKAYLNTYDRVAFTKYFFENIPWLDDIWMDDQTLEDILAMADGPSINAKRREGVVFKSIDNPSVQFKAISNEWLLKNDG